MQRTEYIRTYRGYDLYRDFDPVEEEGWYAALARPLSGHRSAEALVNYPSEQALRRIIGQAVAVTLDAQGRLLRKVEAFLAEARRPWQYAQSILVRQGGPEHLEWAVPGQLQGVIAALYRDVQRHGRRWR